MAQVKDPVCGMTIEQNKAAGQSTYNGATYYFCGEACKAQFDRDPGNYASATGGAST